jgi:Lecithin retinol acyltransferase
MHTAQSQTSAPKGVGILLAAFHTRGRRHERKSRPPRWAFGLHRRDESPVRSEEPPLGAHLVTPRFAYSHHGIYVGNGTVVHYAAFAKHWRRGPVEEISFTRFADGHPVWVRPARPNGLPCAEVVRRARSRLGEDRYRVFTNNCEHLSEWCVNGEHRSPQVERLLARERAVLAVLSDVRRLLRTTPSQRGGV